ncbi:MAG: HugZ family pyridoxamine 5'-phosphate oxidase [Burkholderiales bacterium]
MKTATNKIHVVFTLAYAGKTPLVIPAYTGTQVAAKTVTRGSSMDSAQANVLRDLLKAQQIAALGTLHEGHPFVSMVPIAPLPDGTGFAIHVSRLASHTNDMTSDPHVSLLVMATPSPDVLPQALSRVTIQGEATQCADSSPLHAEAKAAYLARFPQSEPMFSFADFSLFVIQPTAVRFVGGFAQATSLSPESLARILCGE